MINFTITYSGLENIKKKLNKLKNIDRIKIINEIKKARAFGDLKENSEYHAAKAEQSLIEKKIKDLENNIINANIIDETKILINDQVAFGATIELIDLKSKKSYVYKIVGEAEADIKKKKISINSPIAKALIRKKKNQLINIKTPGGTHKYKINNIKYI